MSKACDINQYGTITFFYQDFFLNENVLRISHILFFCVVGMNSIIFFPRILVLKT